MFFIYFISREAETKILQSQPRREKVRAALYLTSCRNMDLFRVTVKRTHNVYVVYGVVNFC